ncbi:MAG: serine/threonine protein kinase [Proteobacteria bacterium]|nr:serine/threonine protein kinase [Pseudomonadota bacterium]
MVQRVHFLAEPAAHLRTGVAARKADGVELGEALDILQQILRGVGYAHQKGFIHRDIKPSNVMMDADGVAKIMDFGISKSIYEKGITKTGTKIGTLLYMSPEQINAEEPTRQSDIYSIGITFYEMLSGLTPFESGTEYEIMQGHLKKPAPKLSATIPGLPPMIDKISPVMPQEHCAAARTT